MARTTTGRARLPKLEIYIPAAFSTLLPSVAMILMAGFSQKQRNSSRQYSGTLPAKLSTEPFLILTMSFRDECCQKNCSPGGGSFKKSFWRLPTYSVQSQQMWWLCHEDRYSQNPLSYSVSYSEILVRELPYDSPPFTEPRNAIAKPDTRSPFHKGWGELLKYYIRTSVTRKDDRLVAIAGLAKVYQLLHFEEVGSADYHSGLWSTCIKAQLGWHTTSKEVPKSRYVANHFIPSWSPVSCDGDIEWANDPDYCWQVPIEFNMNTSGLDQFGRAKTVEQGILHLRGVLVEMTLGPVLFDNGTVENMVWPSTHPRVSFGINWDNQEEMNSAAQSPPNARFRALILSFRVGWQTPEGLLLRPIQNDNSRSPDRWVRCGYLSVEYPRKIPSWQYVLNGIQLERYGVQPKIDSQEWQLEPTGREPDLEDIYLV